MGEVMIDSKIKEKLINFQKEIGYEFNDITLLITALTHSSYANENRQRKIQSNERLEFLGDSVLNIIVSSYIFNNYPHLPEGELTRVRAGVVCEMSLAQCSRKLNIGEHLFLGKGEELTGGRERVSILADAFEALLAAIYQDSNLEKAKAWLLTKLSDTIETVMKGGIYEDYKTKLQELLQKEGEGTVEYVITKETGPDHDRRYEVKVLYNGKIIGKGKGKSKKEAEQESAKVALSKFKKVGKLES